MQPGEIVSTLFTLARGHVPGQLIVQLTDRCNAACPQCGMRVSEKFPRHTLATDDVRRMIDSAAQRGVSVISFTGGEPMLCLDELVDLIRYAGDRGLRYIRTGTNGFLFRGASRRTKDRDRVRRIAERLAETPLRNLWISLDSCVPATHETMRGFPGIVDDIEACVPIFVEHGIHPSANLGMNRNVGGEQTASLKPTEFADPASYLEEFGRRYRTALRRFYELVVDMGFSIVNTCYPMSIDAESEATGLEAVYAATSLQDIVSYSRPEKAELFRAIHDVVTEFRPSIRIFSPLSSLLTLSRQYSDHPETPYPCRGGIDFWFVDSRDGHSYPCGYRGSDDFGHYAEMKQPRGCTADCLRCDWECFRDPSEMFGPFMDLLRRPWRLAARWRRDPAFLRVLTRDLDYYRACDWFDGRRPARLEAMDRFQPGLNANPCAEQALDPSQA